MKSQEVAAPPEWPWPDAMDAVQAAPRHHQLVLENEFVRVLDTRVARGETVPVHTHRWPAVLHLMSWSDFVRRDASGAVLVDTRGRPPPERLPSIVWSGPLPPHSLENVGTAELHVVSIEMKQPMKDSR
ncbi:MAG: hypothetical protein JWM35_990 [Verrucomicrobia bacterium]|nr:hypothetical protein [Verrucomicrobiota bacterium]